MMATEIRPWLRVGPQSDVAAERAHGAFILNVLEAEPSTPYDLWIPVLRADGDEVAADPAELDRVAAEVLLRATRAASCSSTAARAWSARP